MKDTSYENAKRAGVIYTDTIRIKQPGAYQLRVVMCDTTSDRLGSATQFIEVQDVAKEKLALSELAAFGVSIDELKREAAGQVAADGTLSPEEDPEAGAATRRLKPDMVLRYGCFIYNARHDEKYLRLQLSTQVKLFRDGHEIFAGTPIPYDVRGQVDFKRLPLVGAIQLGTEMPPGEYVLQIIATDALASEKRQIATQSIDFEIVP